MNKAELIETVAAELNEPKAQVARYADAFFRALETGFQEDGKVNIAKFGTFKRVHRKERPGINPSTREKITIPASCSIGFAPAKALKDTLNRSTLAKGNGRVG